MCASRSNHREFRGLSTKSLAQEGNISMCSPTGAIGHSERNHVNINSGEGRSAWGVAIP